MDNGSEMISEEGRDKKETQEASDRLAMLFLGLQKPRLGSQKSKMTKGKKAAPPRSNRQSSSPKASSSQPRTDASITKKVWHLYAPSNAYKARQYLDW